MTKNKSKPKKFREYYEDEFSHPDNKRYDKNKKKIQQKRKEKSRFRDNFR